MLHSMTAMTVAILILLTFPLASFVQQTISIVVIPVATNQTAISPAYKRGKNFTDVRPHSNDSVISAKGQEALWDVAGSPFGHQQVFRTCATGNCSFPPYESSAVCSTCVNMTESITIHHPVTDQAISSSPCYGSDSQDSAKKLDCVYNYRTGYECSMELISTFLVTPHTIGRYRSSTASQSFQLSTLFPMTRRSHDQVLVIEMLKPRNVRFTSAHMSILPPYDQQYQMKS